MSHTSLNALELENRFPRALDSILAAYQTAPLDINGTFLESRDCEVHGCSKLIGKVVSDEIVYILEVNNILYIGVLWK